MSASRYIADRFEIRDPEHDLVGRGSMGDVYRATDTHSGELVAVKALDPRVVARDPGILERFVREGEALRQLDHPNIVRMVAAVEEEGATTGVVGHYLVMEYVAGGSLHDLLQAQEALPIPRALEIALDLADALTRAHRQGIIHRDLKPANVLLAEDGTPRLTDFGIAYVADSPRLTQTGVLVGTVDYLSPEACEGEAIDARADIWSFGVMLYEMLSGERPFGGKSLSATLTSILTQPVPDLAQRCPEAPEALVDLVHRMLEKDRQGRIPSVRLVGAELEAILKGREMPTPLRLAPGESRFPAESRFPMPTPPAAAPTQPQVAHNLPAQVTPFVGRAALLAEIVARLGDPTCRLLSLVGPGGSGKTRLALEAAAAQLDNYTHGVFFVPLAPLESSEAIVPAVAKALGFTFYAEAGGDGADKAREQLLRYVSEKQMLLLMDNYEHLLDGVGVVSSVLQAAPGVKVLATSRARLNLGGEHLLPVPGMDVPDAEHAGELARSSDRTRDAMDSSAVKLFVQSARRAQPSFELAADNVADVVQICRLVTGMPLGILLAAGWLELLRPEEIAAQLGGELGSSLDFLETDLHDVPARQRSMRAVFDHSWELLTEREREVMQGLSAFRGGFMAQAADQVTGAKLSDLRGLAHKSLLGRDREGRYEIHELLRQYAAEKLAAAPEERECVKDRHCAYYAAFLQQREARILGEGRKRALEEIATEIDNARAGWDWAVMQGRIDDIDRSLESLAGFYRARGWFHEGEEAFSKAAQRIAGAQCDIGDAVTATVLGKALLQQGRFDDALGLVDRASELLSQSLTIFRALDARRQTAYTLRYLGDVSFWKGEGEDLYQEALSISEDLCDQRGVALSLWGLSMVANYRGDYRSAKKNLQQSLAIFTQIGNVNGVVDSLNRLGWTNWLMGEYRIAKQQHERSLALCRESGDQFRIARALGDLGIDACGLQEYAEANRYWRDSLAIYQEAGNLWGMADVLGDMGELANAIGEYSEGHQFARESLSLREKIGSAYGVAWSSQVLGNALSGLGDLQGAKTYLCRSLAAAVKSHGGIYIPLIVVGISRLLAAQGDEEGALEFLAMVLHNPISCQWAKDRAAPLIAELEAELPPDVVAAAWERGQARDLETTAAELLVQLGS